MLFIAKQNDFQHSLGKSATDNFIFIEAPHVTSSE